MEESEKRRERLKAMRMEAANAEVSHNIDTSNVSGHLSNPFVESSANLLVQEDSPAATRFDFYTDPMAAFSGNKRKGKGTYQTSPSYFSPPICGASPLAQPPSSLLGPRELNMIPSPSHQFQTGYSPNQKRMHETPLPYHGSGFWRSPVGMASPFPGHGGTLPGFWNKSGGTAGYGFSPKSSMVGSFQSSGFGRGGSPSSNSGRGSGRGFNNSPSPGSGRTGRRGCGAHSNVSAQERPELFYNKSMLEDPWRLLKPVVRTIDPLTSWLPKSISVKKARVSEAVNEFSSQSNLAECLAASFEEAANDLMHV